jgi:hypothetical protein
MISEQDTARSRAVAPGGSAGASATSAPKQEQQNGPVQHAQRRDDVQSAPQSVLTFIQEHPVVAAGGALAAGAAIAMLVHSRQAQANRLDRRLMRRARDMERKLSREVRALRHIDLADRASHMTSSLGDALSRVDFNALTERGQAYFDTLRNRIMMR